MTKSSSHASRSLLVPTPGLRGLSLALLLGFLAIAAALGYWQLGNAEWLTSNVELNRSRLLAEEGQNKRGSILASDGQVLVQSVIDDRQSRRAYLLPSAVHVTGHYSIRYGGSNAENSFDRQLRAGGGPDAFANLVDSLLRRPLKGQDVVLALDRKLQETADLALGQGRGAVIVMDPRSGAILALASHPYYDPNTLDRDWEAIKSRPDNPLLNRATQGLYVPGSTFKTLTVAAALDLGLTTPTEAFSYVLAGQPPTHSEAFGGLSVPCANHRNVPAGPQTLDLADAYAASCNVTFARLGERLGPTRLGQYAERVGIGLRVPIDIASEPSSLSSTPRFLMDAAALASTAFGQGELLVTPLQIALLTNAVAADGVIMSPYAVQEVRADGQTVWGHSAEVWLRPFSSNTAREVKEMMRMSVDEGWAGEARVEGVAVAGKTGTAETGPGQPSHAWFTGFAPVDRPVVSVTVIKEYAGFGSVEAAPVARKVLEVALAKR